MTGASPHSEPETMDAFRRLGEWLECERRGSDAPRHYDPRNDIGSLLEQLEALQGVANGVIWLDNNIHNYGSDGWRGYFKAVLRDARAAVPSPASDPFDAGGQVTHVHDPASGPERAT